MSMSPQVESPNVLTIDYQDNPAVREIFGKKSVGDKCTLTIELQVTSKYPEGVACQIEKIITSGDDYSENEAEPDSKEPVMMRMKSKDRKNRGVNGPHGRPPETAENSAEPWMTSYT